MHAACSKRFHHPPATLFFSNAAVAGRSAGSIWCCIVETTLSTIVFVYAMLGAMEGPQNGFMDLQFNFVRLCVALAAAGGIWPGASLCFLFRVQEAVHNTVLIDELETTRLGRSGRADSPGLDGVNLFEYHDVVMIGLNVTAMVSFCLLCVFWWWGTCVCFLISMVLVPFNIFSGTSPMFWCVFGVLFVFWVGCYLMLICRSGLVGRFTTVGEACRTRPSYAQAQPLVLVSSALYAAFLCIPPIPWLCRWSLITTHTARAIKVWKSLDGQGGVVEAHGEFHVL